MPQCLFFSVPFPPLENEVRSFPMKLLGSSIPSSMWPKAESVSADLRPLGILAAGRTDDVRVSSLSLQFLIWGRGYPPGCGRLLPHLEGCSVRLYFMYGKLLCVTGWGWHWEAGTPEPAAELTRNSELQRGFSGRRLEWMEPERARAPRRLGKVVWVYPGAKAAVRGAGGMSAWLGSSQDLRNRLCKKKTAVWSPHVWKFVGLYRCVLGANWRSTGDSGGEVGRILSPYWNVSLRGESRSSDAGSVTMRVQLRKNLFYPCGFLTQSQLHCVTLGRERV